VAFRINLPFVGVEVVPNGEASRPSKAGKEACTDPGESRAQSNTNGKGVELQASPFRPGQISQFETGRREPPLVLLLSYAKLAGVWTDVLIDDKQEL